MFVCVCSFRQRKLQIFAVVKFISRLAHFIVNFMIRAFTQPSLLNLIFLGLNGVLFVPFHIIDNNAKRAFKSQLKEASVEIYFVSVFLGYLLFYAGL